MADRERWGDTETDARRADRGDRAERGITGERAPRDRMGDVPLGSPGRGAPGRDGRETREDPPVESDAAIDLRTAWERRAGEPNG